MSVQLIGITKSAGDDASPEASYRLEIEAGGARETFGAEVRPGPLGDQLDWDTSLQEHLTAHGATSAALDRISLALMATHCQNPVNFPILLSGGSGPIVGA